MSPRTPSTLLELAVARVGLRRGMRAIAFMSAWGVARNALGHPPGEGAGATAAVEEYAAWWRQPLRSAWREWGCFHDAFPDEDTPDRLLDLAAETASDVASLGSDATSPA